jgi:hypothetical protein
MQIMIEIAPGGEITKVATSHPMQFPALLGFLQLAADFAKKKQEEHNRANGVEIIIAQPGGLAK